MVLHYVRGRRHTKHPNVTLSVSVPKRLVIIGDAVRWRQLLIHFLSNALKFTKSGHICLNVLTKETLGWKKSLYVTMASLCITILHETSQYR